MPELTAYLERIGFKSSPSVNVATLKELQRCHLLSIPYEDIDVQLRRPVDLSVEAAFDKLVTRRRGGWCYEMNGLLGWALEQIGFDVLYMSGGVSRAVRGDSALGNHLVLLITVDGKEFVTDVGFGDGFIEPLELVEQTVSQRGFDMSIEKIEDGYWRYLNHQYGGAPSFDFKVAAADRSLLDSQCQWLQTSKESTFVQVLIVQKFNETGYDIQAGLFAKTITPEGVEERVIESYSELAERLQSVFGIFEPEIETLWPKLVRTHEAYLASLEREE